ncbi:MAG: Rieske 2Fe-2S domain-containing protein [Verrucomicrobia bacterium]|nr:Rieske 2Fe-2S domain-containing protein [Verrucomicrobiota bacterium]
MPKYDYQSTRRDFLLKLGVAINAIAGALVGIPIIGFFIASAVKRKEAWVSLGSIEQFPEQSTRRVAFLNPYHTALDGATAQIPCLVKRLSGQDFKVFAINCTHLGCPVRWFEQSKLFLCPCHGGAYYEDGSRAAGPPPRGLYVYEHIVKNGELLIKAGTIPNLSNT